MSNPTPQGGEPSVSDHHEGQVWDDNTIRTRYAVAFGIYPDVRHMALMCWIRDSLQAQIDALRKERDDLAARVNDGEAIEMLRWIVEAYHPQWWYTMEKTGYECAFCKSLFKTSKEFYDTADHKLGCQWARTKAWLEDVKEPTNE